MAIAVVRAMRRGVWMVLRAVGHNRAKASASEKQPRALTLLGVSVLPDWLVTDKSLHVFKRWALPEPHLERRVGIVWTRANVRSPLAQALGDVAVASRAPDNATGADRII